MIRNPLRALLVSLAVAVALIAASGTPTAASAEAAKPTFFLNLTTDDTWTAEMALGFAKRMREAGHPVAVFLNVRAVRLANKKAPQWRSRIGQPSAGELLKALMAGGATVYVCTMCTEVAGLTEADWIDGVKPGSGETIEVLMAPSTKALSY